MNISSNSFKYEGVGAIPGVEVGDKFVYRVEMYVVGLHRVLEAGISCVHVGNVPIASSVVFSGKYRDNLTMECYLLLWAWWEKGGSEVESRKFGSLQ